MNIELSGTKTEGGAQGCQATVLLENPRGDFPLNYNDLVHQVITSEYIIELFNIYFFKLFGVFGNDFDTVSRPYYSTSYIYILGPCPSRGALVSGVVALSQYSLLVRNTLKPEFSLFLNNIPWLLW